MANFRVKQWATFARHWWVFDANGQCPHLSSRKILHYLLGAYKPFYHPGSDCGDHVVVVNTRHIAMRNEEWRTKLFAHKTRYPKSSYEVRAWKVHQADPTRIMWEECYSEHKFNDRKRGNMARLHLYPDAEMPPQVLRNISGQIPAVMPVAKKLHEYSKEERENFPRLFAWPEEYVIDPGLRDPANLPEPEPFLHPGQRPGPMYMHKARSGRIVRAINKGLPNHSAKKWRLYEEFPLEIKDDFYGSTESAESAAEKTENRTENSQ